MFKINCLTDPENQCHGFWLVCEDEPTIILAAAWATDEEPPKAVYPEGWTVVPFTHKKIEIAVACFNDLVKQMEWDRIDPEILEDLWFSPQPALAAP